MRTRFVSWFALVTLACGGGGAGPQVKVEDPEDKPGKRVPVDDGDDDDDDDGDEDGLAVEGLLGTLDRADIQPVIEAAWDDVQACYTTGVGKLRYIGGQLELKFRVDRGGAVKHVHVVNGSLGAWPVEKCILQLAQAMQFPKPKGGEAEFSFPIDFPARGKVVAMEPALVEADVGPKLGDLADCGDAPALTVILYVGAKGQVTMAGFSTSGDQPIPEAWGDCAHAAITGWKLTDPRGTVAKALVAYSGS